MNLPQRWLTDGDMFQRLATVVESALPMPHGYLQREMLTVSRLAFLRMVDFLSRILSA